VRVWGPLRPADSAYQLGVVTKVEGDKATVKRFADDIEQTVLLKLLRVGKLPKGLKVMAYCADRLHPQPARVAEVVAEAGGISGASKVKVDCEKGGNSRVEMASSLSSQGDWLPPRKP